MAVEVFPTLTSADKRNYCVGQDLQDVPSGAADVSLSATAYNYYNAWPYNYHQQHYAVTQEWNNPGIDNQHVSPL